MGDRGNIAVKQYDGQYIYLYTHWGGSEIGSTLQKALQKKWRWGDRSYLARIIFDELSVPHGEETGYGISNTIDDNEHLILYVDCIDQRVSAGYAASWPFEEFIVIENIDAVLAELERDKDKDILRA